MDGLHAAKSDLSYAFVFIAYKEKRYVLQQDYHLSDGLWVIAFWGQSSKSQPHLNIFLLQKRRPFHAATSTACANSDLHTEPLFFYDHQISCGVRTQWPPGLGDGLFFFSGDLPSGLNSACPPSRVPIFPDTSDCVLMNSLNTNQAARVQGVGQGLTQTRSCITMQRIFFFLFFFSQRHHIPCEYEKTESEKPVDAFQILFFSQASFITSVALLLHVSFKTLVSVSSCVSSVLI